MLKNKVALITGGSSGIGCAVALVWAREGAKVVVSDIDVQTGEQTVAMVRGLGGGTLFSLLPMWGVLKIPKLWSNQLWRITDDWMWPATTPVFWDHAPPRLTTRQKLGHK